MLSRLFIRVRTSTPDVHRTYRSPDVFAAHERQKKHATTQREPVCALCSDKRIVVKDLGGVRVIKNDYPYAVFEELPVMEHLMVTTAKHIGNLGNLAPLEAAVYWRVCAEYSDKGYSLFTQSAANSQRSIPDHVHTHLVLCKG